MSKADLTRYTLTGKAYPPTVVGLYCSSLAEAVLGPVDALGFPVEDLTRVFVPAIARCWRTLGYVPFALTDEKVTDLLMPFLENSGLNGCDKETFAFLLSRAFVLICIDRAVTHEKRNNIAVSAGWFTAAITVNQWRSRNQFKAKAELARKGARARYANDPKQQAKNEVKESWIRWQSDPGSYRSKAEFAFSMVSVHEPTLNSTKVIERWCTKWERDAEMN